MVSAAVALSAVQGVPDTLHAEKLTMIVVFTMMYYSKHNKMACVGAAA
jgi:hypothetical protein